MSKYYIAADGGGTKLHVILYDENLHIVREGHTAGINILFKPKEMVEANIERLMDELFEGTEENPPITEITAADLCLVGPPEMVCDSLTRRANVGEIHIQGEPCSGIAAAFRQNGVVVLSGTGSDAFFVKDGEFVSAVGGWGALLGDEGSGYDIGLRAIKAAIYSWDKRKEKSMLYDLVMEQFGVEKLWDIVGLLANNPDARHLVAATAISCAKAANAGDAVALGIYEHAAKDLALQARTVIANHLDEWDGTVTVMGGAWKGCPRMFEALREDIEKHYPQAKVMRPEFDPVVGCVILRCLRDGENMEECREKLLREFKDYIY